MFVFFTILDLMIIDIVSPYIYLFFSELYFNGNNLKSASCPIKYQCFIKDLPEFHFNKNSKCRSNYALSV